jgi:hypothetical protein
LFRGCSKLEEVVIPVSISTIGNSFFQNCINLKSIIIDGNELFDGSTLDFTGSKLTTINSNAFQGVATINKIIFDAENYTVDGYAFNIVTLTEAEFIGNPQERIIGASQSSFSNALINKITISFLYYCSLFENFFDLLIFGHIDWSWEDFCCYNPVPYG